jgi:hypothetical protein
MPLYAFGHARGSPNSRFRIAKDTPNRPKFQVAWTQPTSKMASHNLASAVSTDFDKGGFPAGASSGRPRRSAGRRQFAWMIHERIQPLNRWTRLRSRRGFEPHHPSSKSQPEHGVPIDNEAAAYTVMDAESLPLCVAHECCADLSDRDIAGGCGVGWASLCLPLQDAASIGVSAGSHPVLAQVEIPAPDGDHGLAGPSVFSVLRNGVTSERR